MEKHWELSEEVFEQKFETCRFRPLWFTHEAHLRLAYLYISKYKKEVAFQKYQQQLYDFAIKFGAQKKFNNTVTFAAIQVINKYMNASKADNFIDFLKEFPELKTNFKEVLAVHYSSDIYTSPKAKQAILAPDLIPF